MSLPVPEPGVIVPVDEAPGGGAPRVTVAPITRREPMPGEEAIDPPSRVEHVIGFDDDPSWIGLDRVNESLSPGCDLPGARCVAQIPRD